jgi:hypothetical protein
MREIRVGFSLSDSHFLHRGNHVIDFSREKNAQREVVGWTLSFGTVELCSHGCACLPYSRAEAREVGVRG